MPGPAVAAGGEEWAEHPPPPGDPQDEEVPGQVPLEESHQGGQDARQGEELLPRHPRGSGVIMLQNAKTIVQSVSVCEYTVKLLSTSWPR